MTIHFDIHAMRNASSNMRRDADALEKMASAVEAGANLPTEVAKGVLVAAGFCVIHADTARELLSLVLWAMEQDCPDALEDGETLERLKAALEAA